MKKIRTGVIGVGNMGRHHVRIYSEISHLVAISDINKSVGIAVAKKYKVPFYSNYQEMIERENLSAVSAVIPTEHHKEVVVHCMNKKIPTLVEKPIAASVTEGKKMILASQKNNTFMMVGHVERYNPVIIRLKKIIKQKKIGTIINLLAIRVGMNPPLSKNANVNSDLAIHDVDIFNYLLDEYPKEKILWDYKMLKNSVSDSANIMMHYKNTVGMIQTNWITPIKMRKLYVTGSNGFVELDYINQKLIMYDRPPFKNYERYSDIISLGKPPTKQIYISKKEPLKQELSYFLRQLQINPHFQELEYAIEALKIVSVRSNQYA